jgi:hypothetical protein
VFLIRAGIARTKCVTTADITEVATEEKGLDEKVIADYIQGSIKVRELE